MKGKAKQKKWCGNILLIFFAGLFVYSGYQVWQWVENDRQTKQLEEFYSDVIIETEEAGLPEEKTEIQVDFERLKQINSEVIAWIKIDHTYINYPILQGKTDEYYLRRDIYQNSSISGSIFVDSKTSKDFSDDNTVVYGHNMRNQRMFSNLDKIYLGELGTDITIQIYTEKGAKYYQVFAAYQIEPKKEITQKNFWGIEEKKKYCEQAIQKSKIKFANANLNLEGNILTLITCDSSNQKRIIIHAIEEGK